MALFSPDFARTLRPVASALPAADLDILPTCLVFHDHQRLVFADDGRGFAQEVRSDIRDAMVNLLDSRLCFPPVAAELDLVAHLPLRLGKGLSAPDARHC
jgi:hypothetical protein